MEDIQLIALDGERIYDDLPAVREVAIRVKVNVLNDPEARLTPVLATLLLDVFAVHDGGADDGSTTGGSAGPAEDASERGPVFSGRVTFRIDAERRSDGDEEWVPAVFAEAWPYLRSQLIAHAQILGMGRIPVPLRAPENLAREPRADDE
ncbi:hypothetical protein [Brachybacterium vulturis]|uniref:hypothetical protein n=1 Tax=Brachybacterium vulturis TaxID=2017484 RepID=UPI0015616641|nr:hypothetical protein [Brachybacterium vulturis]